MSEDNTKVENEEEKIKEHKKREYYFSPNYCEVCGVTLPYELRHSSTCSVECTERLEAEKEEKKFKKRAYYFSPNYCVVCGTVLPYEERLDKTCSLECYQRLRDKLMWEGDYF